MTIDKDGLASLLERVREAKGPDKVLDRDILCAIDGWAYEKRGRDRQPWMYGAKGERRDAPGGGIFGAPRPTQSIDASLALTERLLGAGWYSIMLDAIRELGANGVEPPNALPRYILAALLSALKEVR